MLVSPHPSLVLDLLHAHRASPLDLIGLVGKSAPHPGKESVERVLLWYFALFFNSGSFVMNNSLKYPDSNKPFSQAGKEGMKRVLLWCWRLLSPSFAVCDWQKSLYKQTSRLTPPPRNG